MPVLIKRSGQQKFFFSVRALFYVHICVYATGILGRSLAGLCHITIQYLIIDCVDTQFTYVSHNNYEAGIN